MNTHFLYFLFDVLIWTGYGLFLGRAVANFEQLQNSKRTIRIAVSGLFSITLGLFSVLSHGLPESGIAFYNSIYVTACTTLFAFYTSPKIQKHILTTEFFRNLQKRVAPHFPHLLSINQK